MKQNNAQRRNGIILAAALAGASALFIAKPASAQFRVGANGHLNDANNGLGSGGSNGAGSSVGNGVNGNNIVTRDVTGGRGFTGPINISDGRGFFGPTAYAPTDIFNRQSNAPTNPTGPSGANSGVTQYYGDNRFTAPPAGSLPLGFNGGYINDNANSPSSLSSGFNTSTDASTIQARTQNPANLLLDKSLQSGGDTSTLLNQLQLNGGLNISPVYGQHTTDTNGAMTNTLELPEHASLDDITTQQMRRELLDSAGNLNPTASLKSKNANGVQPNPDGTLPPPGLNDPLNNQVSGFEAPLNGRISNLMTSSELPSNQVSSSGIITSNPGQLPSMIPAAADQSSLLKTLQTKLQQSGAVGRTLAENVPLKANTPAKAPAGANPAANPIGVGAGNPKAAAEPEAVSTLAFGIRAKGLHDLLASAEDLVRAGKYDSAIAKYEQAQHVAPNNPLPILGQAQAELGGGYYAKAETDLRSVFRSEASLMLMRFDLTKLYPQDRIAFVRKDLHDLAASDATAVRPWFLLAYLDYNTGDSATAEQDLNEASQRATGGDASIRSLQRYWALPTKAATPKDAAGDAQPAPAATPVPDANK
jgi:hypothetical protein